MNKKTLFIGVLSFGAGIGAGYFACLTRLKEQYKADLLEVKDFYASKLDEMGVQGKTFTPEDFGCERGTQPLNVVSKDDIEDETGEFCEEMSEEYFKKVTSYQAPQGGRAHKVNYNKPPLAVVARAAFAEPDPIDEDEEEYDEGARTDEEYEAEIDARIEELAERRAEHQSNNEPYVINHEEYQEAPDNYTRQVLYYYAKDRTLCEDDDGLVEDEEVLVGFDYEDTLDMQTSVWVRNDILMNVYEIVRIDESYASAVANVRETSRERDFRILGRRKQGLDS